MKWGLLTAVAVSTLVGCSSTSEIQTKKVGFVLPEGWTKGESDDKVATLAVPSGWKQGLDRGMDAKEMASMMPTDSTSGTGEASTDAQKALNEMTASMDKSANEHEKAMLEKLKAKGIIIMCINSSKPIPGEERTQFYLKKESQGGNWSWEDAEGSERKQFKNKPKATKIDLPIGKALVMQDTWQLIDGANYTEISYVIPSGKDIYRLRFITEESPESVNSIAKQVAESLRLN